MSKPARADFPVPRRLSGVRRKATAEARRDERSTLELVVKFFVDGVEHLGTATNISVGGVFVATDAPAAFGATIMVELDLPNAADPLCITSFVRWTNADGMGLQFDLMGARETHALTELLASERSDRETYVP